jgi:D-serine deaminase-like pyridoxal phosphate-dependent protein
MITNADQLPHAGRLTLLRRPPAVRAALARLSREFRDMPRLRLTVEQAARLSACDAGTAEDALRALVASGILIEASDGTFCRAEPALSHS